MITTPLTNNTSIEGVEVSTSSSEYYVLTSAESLEAHHSKTSITPCLIGSIFILSIGICGYLLSSQQSAIEERSSLIVELLYEEIGSIVAIGSSLSAGFTSSTKTLRWPSVAVPDFGEQSSIPLRMHYIRQTIFSPFVSCSHGINLKNQNHVEHDNGTDQAHHLDEDVCSLRTKEITQEEAKEKISTKLCNSNKEPHFEIMNKSGLMLSPIWQTYSHEEGIRWKIISSIACDSDLKLALEDMVNENRTVISGLIYSSREGTPQSFVLVPLYKDFGRIQIVGTVLFEVDWSLLIQEVITRYSLGRMLTITLTSTYGQMMNFKIAHNGNLTYEGSQNSGYKSNSKTEHLNGTRNKEVAWKMNDNRTMESWERDLLITCNERSKEMMTNIELLFSLLFMSGILSLIYSLFLIYELAVSRGTIPPASFLTNSNFLGNSRESALSNLSINLIECQNQERRSLKKDWLNEFLSTTNTNREELKEDEEPIADLFPSTTVMFADIVGFNAWSSEREPHQIFQLLQILYRNFDFIAQQMGIVKIESNGDSYIAVAGLLETKSNHAITMARFSLECKLAMSTVIEEMELILGPGTADLGIRFGLHSGPVIAGILHEARQRLQLFGDTVNIASRLEATSSSGSIHVSQETAFLIAYGGMKNFLFKRSDPVYIKGKGNLQTFWFIPEIESSERKSLEQGFERKRTFSLLPESRGDAPDFDTFSSTSDLEASMTDIHFNEKRNRLIDWNVEVLSGYLTKIMSQRFETEGQVQRSCGKAKVDDSLNVLDEVSEIIILPAFDRSTALRSEKCTTTISGEIRFQLRVYVATIASLYLSKNAFHNFEHASHVLMSASKLMKRIVTSYDVDNASSEDEKMELMEKHHFATFGISSDPLTQFAILFATLIHDVDHPGVSNSTLVDEESKLAKQFKGKSVAEQHSVSVAWNILMQEQFSELQRCIFLSCEERKRFRQLVVNCVMATDIMDRDLQDLRKRRWEKAFPPNASDVLDSLKEEDISRKATIVIEHIIQASDIAHTMQHWHVYTKWNELLFNEMYTAFLLGRSDNDPSLNWYENEIGFFDNYIIPLAKKLQESGVFGVSSDEYLQYALANRQEWERRGKKVSSAILSRFAENNPDMSLLQRAWQR